MKNLRLQKPLGAGILVLCFSGCATVTPLLSTAPPPGPEEAIVIIGVNPKTRLGIRSGEFTADGLWNCVGGPGGGGNNAWVNPEYGFIAVKLKPRTGDKNYGITQLGLGGSLNDHVAAIISGTKTAVFTVPPGAVTYVGSISVVRAWDKASERGGPELKIHSDLARARAWVDKNYPNLVGTVTKGSMSLEVSEGSCGGLGGDREILWPPEGAFATTIFMPKPYVTPYESQY